MSRDPLEGLPHSPATINGYNYANQNPINLTDRSGLAPLAGDPFTACLQIPPCAALLGEGAVAVSVVASPAVGVIVAVPGGLMAINYYFCGWDGCVIQSPVKPAPAPTAPTRPVAIGTPPACYWSADGCKPVDARKPKPKPKPASTTIIDPFPPIPTCTPESSHTFYFTDEGGPYPEPGRDTNVIIYDLNPYFNIQGVSGMVSQLESTQNRFDDGEKWLQWILMGRKFEAETTLFYGDRNILSRVNSTAQDFDIVPRNFAPILYVEVKWTKSPMRTGTINDVTQQARLHPSGTFLLEANNLDTTSRILLEQEGGEQLPFPYP